MIAGLLDEYVKLLGEGYVFFVFIGNLSSDLFFELDNEQYNRSGREKGNPQLRSDLHCCRLTVIGCIDRQTCVFRLSGVKAALR
jgi:hypothetical protein